METQPTQTHYDEAIKHYTYAIELKPDFAIAYNNRGITYRDKGEIKRAIDDFNKAIELQSDYADAYNNRGLTYRNKGDYDRAIDDFNTAIN